MGSTEGRSESGNGGFVWVDGDSVPRSCNGDCSLSTISFSLVDVSLSAGTFSSPVVATPGGDLLCEAWERAE